MVGPQHNYGLQVRFKLSHASQQALTLEAGETVAELRVSPHSQRSSRSVHQERGVRHRARVLGRTVVHGKAVTHSADVVKEVKRGSMRERWGFDVSYRVKEDFSLELLVTGVVPHSPVFRAGLRPGNLIISINNWEVEAMQVVQSVETVLLAGGFFITLGWMETITENSDNSKHLGQF